MNTDGDTNGVESSYCTLEEEIVVFRINGPIDDALGKELESCGTKFLDDGSAHFVMIDLTKSSKFSVNSRIRWVNFLKHKHIGRAAIFGGGALVRVLAMVMINLSKGSHIRYFQTESDARAWLFS